MPREMVESLCPPYHTKVGWAHGSEDVQVGVELEDPLTSDEPSTLFQALLDNEAREVLGAWLIAEFPDLNNYTPATVGSAVIGALSEVSIGANQGLWATLDRAGCNRLIRILRKARDAAFGQDE